MTLIKILIPLLLSVSLSAKLPNNSKAPLFSLKEVVTGKVINLKKYDKSLVVLEWYSPTCPFSSRHTKEKTMIYLNESFHSNNVVWIGIDSSKEFYGTINYMNWKGQNSIDYPILDDRSGKIGRIYGAMMTPHMVIINKGKVVYQGAIDDDTFGDKKKGLRINYVENILGSLVDTGKVPKKYKSYRRAYGCGIKY